MRVLVDSDVTFPKKVTISRNGYAVYRDKWNEPQKYVHRFVAEKAYGKPLPEGAIVHHVNYNKLDNRRCNLVVCPDDAYHQLLHRRTDVLNAGGNPNTQKICCGCKEVLDLTTFSTTNSTSDGLSAMCRPCTNKRRRGKYKKTAAQVTEANRRRREDPVRWARHLEWTRQYRAQKKQGK